MKKLMIALGAVAMAASVQAAQFNWACERESSPVPHKYNTVYMIEGKNYDAVIAALDAGGSGIADTMFSYDLLHNTATPSTKAIQLTNKAVAAGPTTLNGTYEATDSFYFILVDTKTSGAAIADGMTYTASKAYTYQDFLDNKSIIPSGKADTPVNMKLLDGTGSAGVFTGASGTINSVPEPTSAMLLLLGVAGLALRRRRA